MSAWTVVDSRRTTPETVDVDSNAAAIQAVASYNSPDVKATNKDDNSTFEISALGDDSRIWDLYGPEGRVRTYINNHEAFVLLCANILDDNPDVWFVNINNLNERLRWNPETDWFEYYTS